MNRIERAIEAIIFNSRWLTVPFLLGLIIGLAALLYKFLVKLVEFLGKLPSASHDVVIVAILNLVDVSLVANLVLILICSSYENFIAPIDATARRWPEGLTGIGFSGLKQKLLGSIIAIAAVNALEWFVDIDQHVDSVKLGWVVGILITFAAVTLILAIAEAH